MRRVLVVALLLAAWSAGAERALKPFSLPPPPVLPAYVPEEAGAGTRQASCRFGNPEIDKKCVQATAKAFEYYATALDHRRRAYEWNLISTRIIFFLVVLLVLSGLVFASIQFRLAILAARPEKGKSRDELATTLEASLSGFKMKSSVLGVTMLGVSMLFFYAYIRWVYPVDGDAGRTAQIATERK